MGRPVLPWTATRVAWGKDPGGWGFGWREVRLCTELDLLPNFEWFPLNICDGCGMPTGDAYSSGHLVLSLWDEWLSLCQLTVLTQSDVSGVGDSFIKMSQISSFVFSMHDLFTSLWEFGVKPMKKDEDYTQFLPSKFHSCNTFDSIDLQVNVMYKSSLSSNNKFMLCGK